MKTLLLLPLTLLLAGPASAADLLWTRLESATYDCLEHASQVNCSKAAQAAKTYQASLEAQGPAFKSCALSVMGLGLLAGTTPLLGSDASRPQVMGQMVHVRKDCPGAK